MQAQGMFQGGELATLLEEAAVRKSTGQLRLQSGTRPPATLFLLFGHIVNATSEQRVGADVVIDALCWPGGTYHFNPRAMLGTDETIHARTHDLVVAARFSTADRGL